MEFIKGWGYSGTKLVMKACFTYINFHTLRQTYTPNMLNKGVSKKILRTLLGYRSINTSEIYTNWVRKEELERWV